MHVLLTKHFITVITFEIQSYLTHTYSNFESILAAKIIFPCCPTQTTVSLRHPLQTSQNLFRELVGIWHLL